MKYLDTDWFEPAVEHIDGAGSKDVMPLLGYYYCWAVCRGLAADSLFSGSGIEADDLRERSRSPLSVVELMDSKLVDEDFNDTGQAFSQAYLQRLYFDDFTRAFLEETGDSHPFDVSNSWENFDRLASRIDRRLADWQAGKDLNRPWWKFWG